MSFADGRRRRQVVPRWRPWWVTARLGLADARERVRDIPKPDARTIDQRLVDWAQHPDTFHAGDLISTAFGMGCGDRARDVAAAVLKSDARIPGPLRLLAERIVDGEKPLPPAPLELDACERHVRIHKLKTRLQAWPNDALAQMDLAREYTILGQRLKAIRPVTTALALAPSSPFVIRSAARFFLNDGDHDRALSVVLRAPNLSADPWLMAAEVAIAGAVGRVTRFGRAARALLFRGAFSPKHISELACALATVELESGNRRMARKLFVAGLERPTENAAAQAEWAFSEIDNLDVTTQVAPERSYEAEALSDLGRGEWDLAIENARLWRLDEPFSARAAYCGSWTALVVRDDPELALQFADLGLSTKPKDKLLLNNKAVALALLGKPEEARETIQLIQLPDLKDGMEATYIATQGMIEYRFGNPEIGRILYEKAREVTRRQKNIREEAWSMLFQAREERRFDAHAADHLLREAQKKIDQLRPRETAVAARLLEVVSR
jgi:tetratricopeptide (TPR) repeat protein